MNSFQRPRRALIVILALAAVLLALAAFALRVPGVADVVRALPIGPDSGPTPRPPVIDEQPGPLPAGVTGLRELEQSDGQGYRSVGSGFFLAILRHI